MVTPHDRNLALDGLRGLACLLVIGFHVGVPEMGGGWLGVDVFFVLSGYLITGLLRKERTRTGRVRLLGFWTRRLGRLYPAVLVLVVACAPWAGAFDEPGHSYGFTAALALSYTQDFYIAATLHGREGLAHLWSLAVEEQFYLLWPLVVIATRARRRTLLIACAVGIVISLGCLVAGSSDAGEINAIYFAPQGRAFELLAGCALATWGARLDRRFVLPVGVAGLVGLLLLVHFAEVLGSGSRLWLTLSLTCLVSVGLVAAVTSGARMALDTRPLVWFGRRSYGGYLYHPPLVTAAHVLGLRRSLEIPLVVLVTATAAAVSFRYVEEPVRVRVARAVDRRARRGRHRSTLPVPAADVATLQRRVRRMAVT